MSLGHSHAGGHDHGHDHGHSHMPSARDRNTKRLAWTLGLVLLYMGAEVAGGLLTNSLALLADAGHMLSDAASLGLSLFAMWIARRPPNSEKTYGYYRAEILAALANGATLAAISIYIFYEAYQRFSSPPQVEGSLMMAIAIGGLVVNIAGLFLLHGGKSESLNVRGAWLHVLGDTMGSVGAITAGALIWAFGWEWADPVASVLIGILVLWSGWHLLKAAVAVLMEASPGHIDVDAVRDAIRNVAQVEAVHDLHVWTISSGMVALSVHVDVDTLRDYAELMHEIRHVLDHEFGISHSTIQVEPQGFSHEPECF